MNDIGMILQRVAKKLFGDVAPKLEGDYAAGHVKLASVLMAMAAESWDGGADRINREIKIMQSILADAGEQNLSQSPSLRITDLKKTHDELSSQIITLQARIESQDNQEAIKLNTRIWQFFFVSTMERMPSPPNLE